MKTTDTVTLPLADVRALVALGWKLTNHISETDKSATGSIYGIEHAHKTIARVAVKLPRSGQVKAATLVRCRLPGVVAEDQPEPLAWSAFVAVNAEMGARELIEIKATLDRGEVYHGGGGAAPEYSIEVVR